MPCIERWRRLGALGWGALLSACALPPTTAPAPGPRPVPASTVPNAPSPPDVPNAPAAPVPTDAPAVAGGSIVATVPPGPAGQERADPSRSPRAVAPASPRPAPAAAPVPPPVPLGPPRAARTWEEFRLQAARRLVQANPTRTYLGPVPEPLLAIPVLEVELNADGTVRRVHVARRPGQALDTVELAIAAVHRAAPFGAMAALPRPWKWTEVFLFDDNRRFKPRELDR